MEVVEVNKERIYFASQPKIINWAVFVGIFSFGFALSFYSESCFWQLIYAIGSLVIASAFVDHWQELTLDKSLNKLNYTVQNIHQRFLCRGKFATNEMVNLNELKKVKAHYHNGTITFYHNNSTIKVYAGDSKEKIMQILNQLKDFLTKNTADILIQFDYNINNDDAEVNRDRDLTRDFVDDDDDDYDIEGKRSGTDDNDDGDYGGDGTGDGENVVGDDSGDNDDNSDDSFEKVEPSEFDDNKDNNPNPNPGDKDDIHAAAADVKDDDDGDDEGGDDDDVEEHHHHHPEPKHQNPDEPVLKKTE